VTRPDTAAIDGIVGMAELNTSDITPKLDYDTTPLVADLGRQVAAELAEPTGSAVMVANLQVGHGDLVNDAPAKVQIGAAADGMHTAAHGE
jgi:hypothetical protein